MNILLQYWKYVLVLVFFLLFSASLGWMKISNTELRAERDMYSAALEYQNASLLKQKKEYDEKLSKLPTEIEKITVRYKVIYQGIDDWKGDENATDGENAGNYLRSFNY
jgi:predicted negative regulator of RcsB-dependent stress response